MEIFKIVGLGIVATILAITVKQNKPEYALQISIATGIAIFLIVIPKLASILKELIQIADRMNIDMIYFKSIFKIIGIAYIAQFGSQVCKDSGEETIAMKIEFAGKIIIMGLALPILLSILNLIIKLMP